MHPLRLGIYIYGLEPVMGSTTWWRVVKSGRLSFMPPPQGYLSHWTPTSSVCLVPVSSDSLLLIPDSSTVISPSSSLLARPLSLCPLCYCCLLALLLSSHLLTAGTCRFGLCLLSLCSTRYFLYHFGLVSHYGVGGAVRFLVVGTIGQEERPPRGQLWMEQCLTLLKYWPI